MNADVLGRSEMLREWLRAQGLAGDEPGEVRPPHSLSELGVAPSGFVLLGIAESLKPMGIETEKWSSHA